MIILQRGGNPPIISEETWERTQAELARRRASGGRAATPTGGTGALTPGSTAVNVAGAFTGEPRRAGTCPTSSGGVRPLPVAKATLATRPKYEKPNYAV